MTDRRTYLFAGGGSGGHLLPGVAVAEELVRRDAGIKIVFAGSERGIERTVLAETSFSHVSLPVMSSGSLLTRPLRFAKGFARSLQQSLELLDQLRPEAVIGLGGFASVPLGLAASQRGIPLILLEQNVIPGRSTSLLSRMADRVCVSFDETITFLPKSAAVEVTGNPLRSEVMDRVNQVSCRQAGRRPTLLILGGSQGAKGVNEMVTAAIRQLADCRTTNTVSTAAGNASAVANRVSNGHWRHASGTHALKSDGPLRSVLSGWKIVHQTGERDKVAVRHAYELAGIKAEVAPYFDDLPRRYVDADLVITRAGGTTLAELAAFGCPAVVVPYPGSIRDHQQRNAEFFARVGGVEIITEGSDGKALLISTLTRLINDSLRRAAMGSAMRRTGKLNATSHVADLLLTGTIPVKRAA